MAQAFGKTWWGRQWLNSLNNIDFENRLPRGSSYARKGAVTTIDINGSQISAKVSGSRPRPYNVTITLPPFDDFALNAFIDRLTQQPAVISKLLNRELAPEVLELSKKMGLEVFPRQWSDLKMTCSCPDWAVPCKHLAAVIYKVSTAIDNDPFLVFSLHNIDLVNELNRRQVFVTKENTAIPFIADLYFEEPKKKSKPAVYNPENAYRKLSYAALKPLHEPLIALLADYPVFYPGGGNFRDKYAACLVRSVKKAQKILQGKASLEVAAGKAPKSEPSIDTHSQPEIVVNEKLRPSALINGTAVSLPDLLVQLLQIPAAGIPDYQPATAFLHTALYLALHLLANGGVVPQIVQQPDHNFSIRWLPAMLSEPVRVLITQLQEMQPPGIFRLQESSKQVAINKDTAINLLAVFLTDLVAMLQEKDTDDLLLDLFFSRASHAFKAPAEATLSGGIQAWLQKYYLTAAAYKPQVVVEETTAERFSISINISDKNKPLQDHMPLQEILSGNKFARQRFLVLQSLTQLSGFINGLDAYINEGADTPIVMDNAAFTTFLLQMIPAIQLLDIDVLLPKALQQVLKPQPSIKLTAQKGKSFLRLDELLDFDWQIAIGDTLLNEAEFKQLLRRSDTLIKYKSQYIYVSKAELEKLHTHFSAAKKLSGFQLLRAALSSDYYGAKVNMTGEVRDLIKTLTQVQEVPLPAGIHAQLRPYQQRGYSWLYRNAQIGFGSVIADDMGLGKTLQVITTLLKYKEEGLLNQKKALVIAPTGLLTNWLAEIEKFAPALNTHIFHGAGRTIAPEFDILLTSYGIARTEAAQLKKLHWHTVVIDEAQYIKNQDTAQAKAIKSIGADNFIAMSGTPVENRLSELWSIMDYSNRNLLGSLKEFRETFAIPVETYNDAGAAVRLKQVTAPFMMRRLKTDKHIIQDLPDKLEMDCFAMLVKEQASLYQKTLEEAMKEIEAINPVDKKGLFVRQGLVLQMILALKQICNHPAQFLKNNVLDAGMSGKLSLLFDKLDSIMESHEKVLVFTQFAEMGRMLQHFIAERYQSTPLFYHGGCTVKQRKDMVDAFQNNHAEKIFILSLKAAGTGLNLTAANHVIHYDLWWNPAVEAQATDRAYRIGQKSNVMVHRFITKNTFEERINEMIQSKKHLANMTVAAGENWIGNLSNKELKALFSIANA